MDPILQIKLLGGFQIYDGEAALNSFDTQRLQSLLAYLVLHRGAAQARRQIAFLFWPDSSEGQAYTNLRKVFLQFKRALPDADRFVTSTRQTFLWRTDAPCWVDVVEVEQLLKRLQDEPGERTGLDRLLDCYTGPLLPDCYEDWIVPLRQGLHQKVLAALEQRIIWLEAQHAYEEEIHYARRLLNLDPLQERSYLRLMRLHALTGDRTGALQTFHDCVAMLRREYDAEPSPDMRELADQIQAGGFNGNTAPFGDQPPQAKPPSTPATLRKLPIQTTPCIGREIEIERLSATLTAPHCRLLTLYGPGGIGKTRLTVELAGCVQDGFRHGVFFVPLASLNTAENIAPTVASVLGLHLVEGRRPEIQLLSWIRDRELLLVLDNAEHLLTDTTGDIETPDRETHDQSADIEMYTLIEEILQTAPGVKLLVTSREPLDLYDEHTYEVKGLSFTTDLTDARVAQSAAERLFYHQMARVRPESAPEQLPAADRATVRHICQLVDGMPLALELAATQARIFSIHDIAAGIEQNIDMLQARWRGAHERHRSIRAVIDASVNALTSAEQRCLYRLSVFQGSFSYESAQAVADAPSAVLDTLLHKSLLQRTQYEDTTGAPAQDLFGLHPLIRQYTAERLDAFPEDKAQTDARYYRYYADFLDEGMAQWREASYAQGKIAPLAREIENIRAAANWLFHHGGARQRSEYVQHLWDLYRVERRLPEVIELLNEAIQLTQQAIPDIDVAILAQWQRMLGEAYHILGEFEASRRHFEETLRVLHFPLTQGTIKLLTALHRQGIRQVLNRMGSMKLFSQVLDTREREPGVGEAIEAYRQLVDISLFSGDVIRLVNGALYALNLAERAGTSSEQAMTYGLMCLMTGAVPLAKPGQLYERLTLENLPTVEEPERQIDIAVYLSAYYAGRGNWPQLDSTVQPAIEKSRQFHLYRRWGYCQAIWASSFGYRGRFATGLQVWGDLYDRSLASDSFLFILPAWAATGMAQCAIRLGRWQQGIELAEKGLSHLQGKDDAIGLARTYAAIALAQVLLGEVQSALTAADHAMALVENRWPTNYAALECYSWSAEVYLLLWQQVTEQPTLARHLGSRLLDENGLPVTTKQLQSKAYKAWKALQKYAQVFPIGQPGECLIRGKVAWLLGRAPEAYNAWRKGIEAATSLAMPYELGCAHLQLAHCLPEGAPQRATHRHSAELILADSNVPPIHLNSLSLSQ